MKTKVCFVAGGREAELTCKAFTAFWLKVVEHVRIHHHQLLSALWPQDATADGAAEVSGLQVIASISCCRLGLKFYLISFRTCQQFRTEPDPMSGLAS